jgi:hypothetical protein
MGLSLTALRVVHTARQLAALLCVILLVGCSTPVELNSEKYWSVLFETRAEAEALFPGADFVPIRHVADLSESVRQVFADRVNARVDLAGEYMLDLEVADSLDLLKQQLLDMQDIFILGGRSQDSDFVLYLRSTEFLGSYLNIAIFHWIGEQAVLTGLCSSLRDHLGPPELLDQLEEVMAHGLEPLGDRCAPDRMIL